MEQEQIEVVEKLAKEVVLLSRNTLLVKMRFLDVALSQFVFFQNEETTIGTDGKWFLYNPKFVLSEYKEERELITRLYLHTVMHCIFRHMYVHTLVDRPCWNLACDIAVEYSIYELGIKAVKTKMETEELKVFKELQEQGIILTAEKIYRYYMDKHYSEEELAEIRKLFAPDDHEMWYMTDDQKQDEYGLPNNGNGENNDSSDEKEDSSNNSESAGVDLRISYATMEQTWKDISERIQTDIDIFSRTQGQGTEPGGLEQNLKEVNREKYDYSSFLKKFAVMGEAMKINDDEFDYIYYTYGLKLFKKVPLVEPLEYKEVKRIKEFVIAIDTSGSTSGELVQAFVQKTYNILKTTESFFQKMNLHIIQCDAAIQQHVKITSQEEFDRYLSNMRIYGHGGTDFRPVFEMVDNLILAKEFSNMKGLIYFTDGYGTYPEKMPSYNVAVVYVQDGYNNPIVPSWAIKLVLQREDI